MSKRNNFIGSQKNTNKIKKMNKFCIIMSSVILILVTKYFQTISPILLISLFTMNEKFFCKKTVEIISFD